LTTVKPRLADPTQRVLASLQADILEREHVGKGVTI